MRFYVFFCRIASKKKYSLTLFDAVQLNFLSLKLHHQIDNSQTIID